MRAFQIDNRIKQAAKTDLISGTLRFLRRMISKHSPSPSSAQELTDVRKTVGATAATVHQHTTAEASSETAMPEPETFLRWQTCLTGSSRHLLELSQSTEAEFLELGERLQRIHTTNRHNAQLAESVSAEMITSRSRDLEMLDEILRAGFTKAADAEAALRKLTRELAAMVANIDEIVQLNDLLDRIYRSLRMVRVMIRIETESAGCAEFHTVAEALISLEELIARNAEQIYDASSRTRTLISGILERFSDGAANEQRLLQDDQQGMPELIAEIRDELTMIGTACSRMGETTQSIATAVNDVVMNLQFHDNYRQRLEHISHTLDDVTIRIEEVTRCSGNADATAKQWLLTVLNLEIAQLENLKAENRDVPARLESAFGAIQQLMQNQVEVTDDVKPAMLSLDEHAEALDRELQEFCAHLETYRETNSEMLASADRLPEHVSGITGVSSLIETNELNLRLLALNSMIKATAIGKRGKTLAVLSREINTISQSVQEQISARGGIIQAIHDGSEKVTQQLVADFRTCLTTVDASFATTSDRIQNLISKDTSASRCSEVSQQLQADFSDLVSQLQFSSVIEGGLNQVMETLRAVRQEIDTALPDPPPGEGMNDLDLQALKQKYTMQSEREVHRSALNDVDPSDQPAEAPESDTIELFDEPQSASADSEADDWGDNVDLF